MTHFNPSLPHARPPSPSDTAYGYDPTYGWIHLHNLHIKDAHVGINPQEYDQPQDVIVQASVYVPTALCIQSEKLDDTLDYRQLAQTLLDVTRSRHHPLLESLCEALASSLLSYAAVDIAWVEVQKPNALDIATISVSMERRR